MRAELCSVQVRLPRALFRRLAAQAIEERTDLSTVIIRAVQSDLPQCGRMVCRKPRRERRPLVRK
jgi:hypothetical protein